MVFLGFSDETMVKISIDPGVRQQSYQQRGDESRFFEVLSSTVKWGTYGFFAVELGMKHISFRQPDFLQWILG